MYIRYLFTSRAQRGQTNIFGAFFVFITRNAILFQQYLLRFYILYPCTITSAEVPFRMLLTLLQKSPSARLGTTKALRRAEQPFLQHGDHTIQRFYR